MIWDKTRTYGTGNIFISTISCLATRKTWRFVHFTSLLARLSPVIHFYFRHFTTIVYSMVDTKKSAEGPKKAATRTETVTSGLDTPQHSLRQIVSMSFCDTC